MRYICAVIAVCIQVLRRWYHCTFTVHLHNKMSYICNALNILHYNTSITFLRIEIFWLILMQYIYPEKNLCVNILHYVFHCGSGFTFVLSFSCFHFRGFTFSWISSRTCSAHHVSRTSGRLVSRRDNTCTDYRTSRQRWQHCTDCRARRRTRPFTFCAACSSSTRSVHGSDNHI